MDNPIKKSRLTALIVFILALAGVFLASLYNLQIVEGKENFEKTQNAVVRDTYVSAARGNILDRYGRTLVSNRTCNNIVINSTELFDQEDPNAIILELVRAVEDSGNSYIDELPITKEAPFEYKFAPQMESIQRERLEGYLKEYKLPASTSAVELMAYFRKKFEIDDNYTSEEMRIIAGVRFEIKIRWIVGTADYIFAEDVSIDLITKLMEKDVPGFDVQQSYVREYSSHCAAHILGYVGMMNAEEYKNYRNEGYSYNAVVGKDGAELAFEKYLHGTDGRANILTTPGGTIINTDYIVEPQPGNHVYLTLDNGLQEAAEMALSAFIENANAERVISNAENEAIGNTKEIKNLITGGGVAAVNVKTGEPLCLASYPSYNLETVMEDFEELIKDKNAPLFNRALMGAYAPGSTFKPMTALAALKEGTINTGTTIDCVGVYSAHADQGYAPECWIYARGGTHGPLNVVSAIQNSCNYYFYDVGAELGIDKLSSFAKRFGLGTSTGIELPESVGNMSTQEYKEKAENLPWYIGDSMQAAIGQSYSLFTPLQLANYCATIANNGVRYEASILKSVRSYDYSQSLYQRVPTVAANVFTEQEHYDAVKLGMYQVANTGVGSAYATFYNFPVKVAAKTGTSQLGEGKTNNGIFICYAPFDDPEIAVAVAVEHGISGSSVSTIARAVLEYYFAFKNSTEVMETENTLLK